MEMSVEICREGDWDIILPAEELGSGSLYIQPRAQDSDHDLFVAMQKVAQFWESFGVKNYLIYTNSREKGWEMVPFPGSESEWDVLLVSALKQIFVISRVIWGRDSKSEGEQEQQYTEYKGVASIEVKTVADDMNRIGNDVFCQRATIDKQLIWEGKNIYILYDYDPLGEDKLHFLLMPKRHKEKFVELSLEEFREMQEEARKIIGLYPDYISYQFFKIGELAGQTVNHLHEHLVFVKPQNESQAYLDVYRRMVKPSPLSPEELGERVNEVKAKYVDRYMT